MAAILRFGAEDLFREDEAAEEKQGHAVMEEDLDAILARAEVSRGVCWLLWLVVSRRVISRWVGVEGGRGMG